MKPKIIFFIFLITLFFSCKNNSSSPFFESYPVYFCDAEKITDDSIHFHDSKYSDILYNNARSINSEHSFSGKHSIKLNSDNSFGFTCEIENIKINDYYKISVWKYSENKENGGHLVISIGNKELYIQQKEVVKKDTSGWEQIAIHVRIPPFIKTNTLKVYVWQAGKNNIWFDDLRIEKNKNNSSSKLDSLSLRIFIDKFAYDKLIKIRNNAMELGILETTDNSRIDAICFDKDNMYDVKIRLKGDWTDHISGTKWSFRIKMKNNSSWKGMREFSIQDPKTRFFQYEWLGHKIMEAEDVLTPRYGFLPVYINNAYIGIYAYEEHFVKQLPESKKRREGPIIKLSENGFWTANKLHNTENKWFSLPVFESSTELPYKLNKTLKNENLKHQFLIAQNLLAQHKNYSSPVCELFDTEKTAKYYALIDLTKMYHGIRWHNQRFYYNPISSELEIIAYDGYTEKGVFQTVNRSIIGNLNLTDFENLKPESKLNFVFFTDSAFLNSYVFYLKKYSDSVFLNRIFQQYKHEINLFNSILSEEYPEYQFNKDFYYKNAAEIRKDLPEYIKKVRSGIYTTIHLNNTKKAIYKKNFHSTLPKDFIKVYTETEQNGRYIYKIINYLSYNINITGIQQDNKKNKTYHKLKESFVGAYNSENNTTMLESEYSGNTLIIKVEGFDDAFSIPIYSWTSPKLESPRQKLIKKSRFPLTEYYGIQGNIITFKPGKIRITQNIIIPENYTVIINAGTELDFIENSLFLSYSPIYLSGKENNKILINSSDNTAKGFTIIQAKQKSELNYVDFTGFNTLNYDGWTLTGAVNFYESDVIIKNTGFNHNVCEDALNIIRSHFIVQDCSFENIYSDAFDSDFCTGELTNTTFNEIGNDAIDFSGSIVDISDCNITNVGDKGISGGENSKLNVNRCFVSDSKIGIASKDKSTVKLTNCEIKNCYYGLVVFQKKPEYGAASIKSTNLTYSNLINLHLIEKKSILQLNKKKIIGYDKNTAKRFY